MEQGREEWRGGKRAEGRREASERASERTSEREREAKEKRKEREEARRRAPKRGEERRGRGETSEIELTETTRGGTRRPIDAVDGGCRCWRGATVRARRSVPVLFL